MNLAQLFLEPFDCNFIDWIHFLKNLPVHILITRRMRQRTFVNPSIFPSKCVKKIAELDSWNCWVFSLKSQVFKELSNDLLFLFSNIRGIVVNAKQNSDSCSVSDLFFSCNRVSSSFSDPFTFSRWFLKSSSIFSFSGFSCLFKNSFIFGNFCLFFNCGFLINCFLNWSPENIMVNLHFKIKLDVVDCVFWLMVELNWLSSIFSRSSPHFSAYKCGESLVAISLSNFNINLVVLFVRFHFFWSDVLVPLYELVCSRTKHPVTHSIFAFWVNQINWWLLFSSTSWESFWPVCSVLRVIPVLYFCQLSNQCIVNKIGIGSFCKVTYTIFFLTINFEMVMWEIQIEIILSRNWIWSKRNSVNNFVTNLPESLSFDFCGIWLDWAYLPITFEWFL